MSANYDVIIIFWFMDDLEQSGSGKPDIWSVIFTFSLIAVFYLIKIENRT